MKNNRHIGHIMAAKLADYFRLYYNNFNGFWLDAEGGDFREFCYLARETQADMAAASEHNLDTTKYHIRSVLEESRRYVSPTAKLLTASSPTVTSGNYKPGGTMMLTDGPALMRLIASGTDEIGRWCYNTFVGRDNQPVTFVIAYQVCRKRGQEKGKYTAANQQESFLRENRHPITDPRKAFRHDLRAFVKERTDANQEVVLFGDFNEALGSDPSGMSRLCSDFGMIDIYAQFHGHEEFATYARGKVRLDYLVATPRAAGAARFVGYEPFNHRMFSDHRGAFADFDMKVLFGGELAAMPPIKHRDIRSNDHTKVTVYIEEMHRMCHSRNDFARAQLLFDSEERDDELAETISRDVDQFRTAAVKSMSKHFEPDWSVSIAAARNKMNILKRAIFIARTKYDVTDQIAIMQDEAGGDYVIPNTVKECNVMLREAQTELDKLVKASKQKRDEEALDRQVQHDLSGDPSSKKEAAIQRKLKAAEDINTMFARIGSMRKEKSGSLNYLDIPTDPDDKPKAIADQPEKWTRLTVPTAIEAALQAHFQKHFGQAQGTPFTVPPLSSQIDFSASTHTAEMILDGSYDASALSEPTQLLIKHFKRHLFEETVPPMSPLVTEGQFIDKFKLWKERTSTSPSGFHLGHWKSLVARHSYSGSPEDDPKRMELDKKQRDLRRLALNLINYALKWGYSYDRWKTIVNVMILKEPGNLKIHRLRVIHLYEADYNFILAVKWRELLHRVYDQKLLHPGLNGSIPDHNAHDPVFIEETQNDISRCSRKSLIKFDNDATSCYDRILVALANISSRQCGMPKEVTFVMANTLEEAKYKLKTMLGVTESYYQHCVLLPIYGSGQGSGNSPGCWVLISTALFTSHDSCAHGATYSTPDGKYKIRITMVGFVDDSTGQVNDFEKRVQPLIATLVEKMQEDAQLWNDLLWSSGGDLELPKCSYHVLHWIFSSTGAPLLESGNVGAPIKVKSGDGMRIQPIKQKSAYTAHKTLGHYKEPSGNQRQQYKKLKEKSDTAAKFVACSPLDTKMTWTYFFVMYLPSIGFPLPNCHFSRKELSTIQRKAYREIFAKCGFNRNTKLAVMHGPQQYGGASFRHLYTEQGVGQVLTFLRHWRSNSQASSLLRIAVAWLQLSLGTGVSFLQDVHTAHPHCEAKWLASLRIFLASINGSIDLDETFVPPLQRERDFYLMDDLISSGDFNAKQLFAVNYCRVYLQVVTISDMSMADGATLDMNKRNGNWSLASSRTKLNWINQERPPDKAWGTWRRACDRWATRKGKLHRTLGCWIHSPDEQRMAWPAYYAADEDSLYVSENGGQMHSYFLSSDMTVTYGTGVLQTPPATAHPASINATAEGWALQGPLIPILPSIPGPIPGTFDAYLKSLDPWEVSLFEQFEYHGDIFVLCEAMEAEEFDAASDGSVYRNGSAAFGWILSVQACRLVQCSGPAYGHKPSSYRAEAYGMLSFVRFLYRLSVFCQYERFLGGTLVCDNISLVNNVTGVLHAPGVGEIPELFIDDDVDPDTVFALASFSSRMLISDWDALTTIQETLETITYPLRIEHIKSHQDDKKPYNTLSLHAQLNVDADQLANLYQRYHGAPRPTVLMFPNARAQLQLNGETITHNYKSTLRYAASAPELKSYIRSRNRWSRKTFDQVDWDAHGAAIARGVIPRTHTVKLIHDVLPTNYRVSQYSELRQARCPCCPYPVETFHHILRCPSREDARKAMLDSVKATLSRLQTRPILKDLLLDGLTSWLEGESDVDPDDYEDMLHRLITQQNKIGWHQLFQGRFSKEWTRLQHEFLDEMGFAGKKRTGHLWTVAVTTKIWQEWYKIWEARNQVVHGHDQATKQTAKRTMAIRELSILYSRRLQLLPSDRDHLFPTLAEHASQSTHQIVNWLNTFRSMFRSSISRAKSRASQGTLDIRSYFTRFRQNQRDAVL